MMVERLSFKRQYAYDLRLTGITVPVALRWGGRETEFKAKVDCGSTACIFSRNYGEDLGLNIESGRPQRFETVTGGFFTYGREVTLSVLEIDYVTMVYFAADPAYHRNVLGRQGWIDRSRFGLVDYEGKLFLSDYNDPTD